MPSLDSWQRYTSPQLYHKSKTHVGIRPARPSYRNESWIPSFRFSHTWTITKEELHFHPFLSLITPLPKLDSPFLSLLGVLLKCHLNVTIADILSVIVMVTIRVHPSVNAGGFRGKGALPLSIMWQQNRHHLIIKTLLCWEAFGCVRDGGSHICKWCAAGIWQEMQRRGEVRQGEARQFLICLSVSPLCY